jgi:hypothetical protein
LTILFTLGVAAGLEFKDVHYANGNTPIKNWNWSSWDWIDFICTIAGGCIGQIILLLIIWIIFR